MPSPFPGMDPFIEAQVWEDFHTRFNTVVSDALNPRLPEGYISSVETRVTVSEPLSGREPWGRKPDVFVSEESWKTGGDGGAVVLEDTAVETEYALLDEQTEHYVTIRDAKNREVVTVIETLSPRNKRRPAGEPSSHEQKRLEVLASDASLVEIDLLRRGHRPATVDPLPPTEYAVFISPSWRRPKVEVIPVPLLRRLPSIGVPLREGESPVLLDLQEAVDTAYARGFYHRQIDYGIPIEPPLPDAAARLLAGQTD